MHRDVLALIMTPVEYTKSVQKCLRQFGNPLFMAAHVSQYQALSRFIVFNATYQISRCRLPLNGFIVKRNIPEITLCRLRRQTSSPRRFPNRRDRCPLAHTGESSNIPNRLVSSQYNVSPDCNGYNRHDARNPLHPGSRVPKTCVAIHPAVYARFVTRITLLCIFHRRNV